MKIKNITILSFLTIALLSGCENKETIESDVISNNQSEQTTHQSVKTTQQYTVPTFKLKTSTGKTIEVIPDMKTGWKFKGLGEKVVLIDFFGTWCPPCKAEIPHLNNIREKLGKDFEVLGVDIGKRGGGINSADHLKEFITKHSVKYPITIGGDNGKLFGAVSNLNPNGSIPFMVLFNKKGEYLKYYIGMTAEEILYSDISRAIKMN